MVFKMKGNPFQRNFGTFEEQQAAAAEAYESGKLRASKALQMAQEDYESGYSKGIRDPYLTSEGTRDAFISPDDMGVIKEEPKKRKRWWKRKPKGERNRKTWWNPFD